jgi:hypothetical protein
MAKRLARSLRVEAVVDAPVEAVWEVVADVTRTGEWSHECRRVEWVGGVSPSVVGARFRGGNKAFVWRWTRTNELIELEAGRLIAWRTIPTWRFIDSTVWRITVDAMPTGTRIVQTYDVVKCPRWWEWLVARVVPPHRDRSAALTADLHRIGDVAAAGVAQLGTRRTSGR